MYQPIQGGSVTLSVTAANTPALLPQAGVSGSAVYVANHGTVGVAIRVGKGAQVAVLTDFVIPPGRGLFLAKGQGADGVAAIGLGAGPTTVTFSACDGSAY